jgi:type I restriction enzyme S subunit
MKTTIKKVSQLINDGIMCPPIDGNHGEKHPKTADYVDDGIPFILVPDLKDGIVDLDNCNHISYDQAKTLNKGFSKTGDVLFTHKATIGKVAIVDTKEYEYIILTPQVTYYRVKKQDVLSYVYLYYYFCSNTFQNTFRLYASSGGTRDYLGIVAQQQLPIIFPNIEYQLRIVAILEKYDKLIRNNNKRIKLLEQMAENLYKEWFVRFRFPGHETAEFENGIPKGWEIKRIGDFVKLKSGYAFKSEWWIDDGVPAIKIKDIDNNTVDLSDLSCVSEENAEKSKNFFVTAGDLLIALTGATIGKIALVPYYEKTITVNQRVGKFFLGKEPCKNVGFLFCLFQQKPIQDYIVAVSGSNAAQPNISPFDIERIKIRYNEGVIDRFNRVLYPTIEYILKLRKINRSLICQRDLLLPRLMSGKLEV